MAESDFTQISVGPRPVQVCPPLGDGQTVTLYNADLVNLVTVSRNNSVAQNGTNGAPIQPLTSAVMSASKALYAVAPAGTAPLVVIPEGGTLSPSPAQIAAQISALGLATELTQQLNHTAINTVNGTLGTPSQDPTVAGLNTGIPTNIFGTGVPLYSKSSLFASRNATSIAANGNLQIGPSTTITQIGYTVGITVKANAASLNPFVTVNMIWSDSLTGLVVGTEAWVLAGGTTLGVTYYGTGPTKGDTLEVLIVNDDTLRAMTVSCVVTQNSRVYARDDWRQPTVDTVPGFSNPNQNPPSNQLAQASPSVAVGATVTRLLPLYAGRVFITVIGTTDVISIDIQSLDPSLTSGAHVFDQSSGIGVTGGLSAAFSLPRAVCSLNIINTAASGGAVTVPVSIVIEEYQT